jgi:hypothetical protein
VPSQILNQWDSEFAKFAASSRFDQLNILTIDDYSEWSCMTVRAVQAADIVLMSYRVLDTGRYNNRLKEMLCVPYSQSYSNMELLKRMTKNFKQNPDGNFRSMEVDSDKAWERVLESRIRRNREADRAKKAEEMRKKEEKERKQKSRREERQKYRSNQGLFGDESEYYKSSSIQRDDPKLKLR